MGASVRARLFNESKKRSCEFELILTRFVLERLLYRLAQSRHGDRFVLKGAMLLTCWLGEQFRSTRDLDLLSLGDPSPEALAAIFREVLSTDEQDGVVFNADEIRFKPIREQDQYGGLRLRTTADVGGARIAVQIDVGFGDATDPAPEFLDYPVLLDMPAPRFLGYARETVVAEKFHAMVEHGAANSRMKDYYDLWALTRLFEFDHSRLATAIASTFALRKTEIPDRLPAALSPDFAGDPAKRRQWESFKRDLLDDPGSLSDVIGKQMALLMSAAADARKIVGAGKLN